MKSSRLQLRLTEAQRAEFDAEAKRLGLSPSVYVRSLALQALEATKSIESPAEAPTSSEPKPEAPAPKPRATGFFGRSRFGRSFMH